MKLSTDRMPGSYKHVTNDTYRKSIPVANDTYQGSIPVTRVTLTRFF